MFHYNSNCTTPGSQKVLIPENSNQTRFTDNNVLDLKQLPYHFHKNGGFVNVAMAVFLNNGVPAGLGDS